MITHNFLRADRSEVTPAQMINIITEYILQDTMAPYEFTVGTDSQNFDKTKIVEVIAVHRLGRGGIFFTYTEFIDKIDILNVKIVEETQRSLANAEGLVDELDLSLMEHDIDINDLDIRFQIHCDIGTNGKTSMLIKEITNWVTSLGYTCCIKPESYAASGIANKYSK